MFRLIVRPRTFWLMVLLVPSFFLVSRDVVSARGTPVTRKGLEFEDNKWAKGEDKTEQGRFDNLVSRDKKKPNATTAATTTDEPREYGTVSYKPTPTADAASDLGPDASSQSGNGLVWAILGTLLVGGAGLACFGYYWSNVRRVASW